MDGQELKIDETRRAVFFSNIDKRGEDECWPWLGATDKRGYGQFKVLGRQCKAHRISFALANNAIDDSLLVMHSCDTPGCQNPKHLSQGTNGDNMADKTRKGRQARGAKLGESVRRTHPRTSGAAHGACSFHPNFNPPTGERNGACKLTDRQVALIRSLSGCAPQSALGRLFGVAQSHIGGIISGKKRRF